MSSEPPAGRTPAALFDPAAQNERTALAWSRTVASLIVALLIVVRVSTLEHGPIALIVLAIGAPVAVGLLVASRHRYRHVHAKQHASDDDLPDMKLPALLAGMCILLGLVQVVSLLTP